MAVFTAIVPATAPITRLATLGISGCPSMTRAVRCECHENARIYLIRRFKYSAKAIQAVVFSGTTMKSGDLIPYQLDGVPCVRA